MKKSVLSVVLLFLGSLVFAQNVYYVSPNGDDSASGDFNNPWKTPIKAGMTAQAGDTVFFFGGIYKTGLYCLNSGNAQDGYITYTNYQDETVIFDGKDVPNQNDEYNVWFEGFICNGDPSQTQRSSYLRIKGIHVREYETWFGILMMGPSSHIEIIDCKVYDNTVWGGHAVVMFAQLGNQNGIISGPMSNIVLDGNEVYNNNTGGNELMTIYGAVDGFQMTNNIVHDGTNICMDMIGRDSLDGQPFGRPINGLVKGNICYHSGDGSFGSGIYTDGAGTPDLPNSIVIENNICFGNDFCGIEIGDEHPGEVSGGILVQNNIVYDNGYYGLWVGGGGPGTPGKVKNVNVYNNISYNNAFGELALSTSENIVMKNNIFYKSPIAGYMLYIEGDGVDTNNTLDYNCWFPDGTFKWEGTEYNSFAQFKTATGQSQYGILADPLFVDPLNNDFHLQPQSPCIDAATSINAPLVDFDGISRPQGNDFDIGAYEYMPATTNYYVSNSGSDANSGTSLSDPFLTIQHAVDLVNAGDTIFIENGTYTGFDLRDKSGVSGNPIVIKSLGNSVVIDQKGPIRNDIVNVENSGYVVIDGLICNDAPGNGNGIRVVTSNFCVVRNCSCDHNAKRGIFTAFTDDILIENNVCTNSLDEHGIYVSNSSDRPIIRYNECFGNADIGIHMNGDLSAGGDGIISDAEVYGNILHDNNLGAGINMDGVQNPKVYNNLIYNNHNAQGIALFQQNGAVVTSGAKIYNNTIIVPSDGRWGIHMTQGANQGTEVYNNIVINNHAWRGAITVEDTAGLKSDYNVLTDRMSVSGDGSTIPLSSWQNMGLDIHSQPADPMPAIFVNPLANDYQLLDSSQAKDAGIDSLVDMIVIDDILKMPRPGGNAYDIGAYEKQSTVPVTWLSFDLNLTQNDKVVLLEWKTAYEYNNYGFWIQHKEINGWQNIGFVPAHNAQNVVFQYSFTDHHPSTGKNYYRIKQVDLDGTFSYSNIEGIFISESNKIEVFPNPVLGKLSIKGFQGEVQYTIISPLGKVVKKGVLNSYRSIDVKDLDNGRYFIIIRHNNLRSYAQFVKAAV